MPIKVICKEKSASSQISIAFINMKCPWCDQILHLDEELDAHLVTHQLEAERASFQCSLCGILFITHSDYDAHCLSAEHISAGKKRRADFLYSNERQKITQVLHK